MANIEKILNDLSEALNISEEALLESPQNKHYVEFGICSQSATIIEHIRKLQLWGYESTAIQTLYDVYENLKLNYMVGKKTRKAASKHLEKWLKSQYAGNYQEYIEGIQIFIKSDKVKNKYTAKPKEVNQDDFERCKEIYDYIISCLLEEDLKDREEFYNKIKQILGFEEN